MATTKFEYTPTLGTLTKWTFSGWFKKSGVTGYQQMIAVPSGSAYTVIKFETGGQISFENYDSGGSSAGILKTNRLFRDPAAWYHVVAVWDSANASAGDRMKLYVNGVEETDFATDSNPDSSETSTMCANVVHYIGANNASDYFNGSMSWVQLVDNAALAPTEFGSVDATSGIWKINPSAYATPGTAGFCLKMEDRTNLDLDSSSNAYTFTTTGTPTPTTDNPSNNFCTMNSNVALGGRSSFTWVYGNNKVTTAGSAGSGATMGVMGGKWYYELYIDTLGNFYGGWQDLSNEEADLNEFVPRGAVCMNNTPDIYYNGSGSAVSTGYKGVSSVAASGYYGFAFDVPNLKCWWSENGQWYTANSGTASTLTRAEVTSNTSGFDCTTASTMSSSSIIGPFMGCSTSATTNSFNFGNGVFGTTALTGTTYTDDNDQGVFKYEPPDGFRALCTKNIKAYGG